MLIITIIQQYLHNIKCALIVLVVCYSYFHSEWKSSMKDYRLFLLHFILISVTSLTQYAYIAYIIE